MTYVARAEERARGQLASMTDDKKTTFVIGAGRGRGNHVAERFGHEGFRVVLMSKSAERLDRYAQEFRTKGIETDMVVMDVPDLDPVSAAIGSMREVRRPPPPPTSCSTTSV